MKTIRLKSSLVVVGGGPAGICAALAAARMGVDTVLVHNRPVLGGNSSSEVRVWMRGATGGGNLFSEEMGVLGILKMKNLYANQEFNPIFWDEILLDAVLGEPKIQVLLNTHIEKLECRNAEILSVTGVQQSSEIIYTLAADYFIDATGDGTLGDLAGVPYQIGSSVYDKEKQQEQIRLLSSSILYYVKDTGKPVKFIPPDYAYDIPYIDSLVNKGGRYISEKQTGSDCWWFEFGGLHNTISDAQEIGLELRKLVMGVWNYIKNSGRYPDADTYTLEWVGSIPGKRESRRMITDYILDEKDVIHHPAFEDAGFYGGWYMDFHPAEGLNSTEDNCVQIPVQAYQIPLRCLYNSHFPNLVFAGRIIGTRQEAYASTRIMNTCALSGQAAAALVQRCLRTKKSPSALEAEDIKAIQNTLVREDMFLPGVQRKDPEDLALEAQVTASSQAYPETLEDTRYLDLSEEVFLTIPDTHAKDMRLMMKSDAVTEIKVRYYRAKLPSRSNPGEFLEEEMRQIPQGTHWILLTIPQQVKGYFTVIHITGEPAGKIVLNQYRNPGFLCGRKDSSQYESPCIKIEDRSLYAAANITDGYSRPYGGMHMWCSDREKNPWVCLDWKKEICFREIRLFLEPDLSKEIPSSCAQRWDESHRFTARRGMPEQLIKSFKIYGFLEGQWREIAYEKENWNRMAVVKFETLVRAEKLKIEICDIWGEEKAQIYKVSVYRDFI